MLGAVGSALSKARTRSEGEREPGHGTEGDVEVDPGYAVICVVGDGLRASTGLASKIFSTIDEVNIALVSHGASAVNLTFVVKEDLVANVIRRIHQKFFQHGKY